MLVLFTKITSLHASEQLSYLPIERECFEHMLFCLACSPILMEECLALNIFDSTMSYLMRLVNCRGNVY